MSEDKLANIAEARDKLLRSVTATAVTINKAPKALEGVPTDPIAQAVLGQVIDTLGSIIGFVKVVWSNS